MPRPAANFLQAKLPCGSSVDNVKALEACEAAAASAGFNVVVRTRRSLVFMPGSRQSAFSCMVPGFATSRGSAGITAELVADEEGSLAVSVASSTPSGREFVSALSSRLESLNEGPALTTLAVEDADGSCTASRFKRESQAYYYYAKLLCDPSRDPGREALDFVQSFTESCTALKPNAVQQGRPMSEALQAIERLCRLLEEVSPRQSENSPCDMQPRVVADLHAFLQPAVERFIFKRVGPVMWRLYEQRHSAEDAQFLAKVHKLAAVPDAKLFQALEIRPEFRGQLESLSAVCEAKQSHASKDEGSMESQQSPSTRADSDEVNSNQDVRCSEAGFGAFHMASSMECSGGFYERAAAQLSQVEVAFSTSRGCVPREAMEALVISQLEMKTCALEASCGQLEINSMDDVMPVFIFVMCRSGIQRPFACASYISDVLTADERLESEGRAVLLLESAARHIAFDWDVEDLMAS